MAKKPSKKKVKRQVASGRAYIHASYNNTIVTITDPDGNPITWSSGGVIGYKEAVRAPLTPPSSRPWTPPRRPWPTACRAWT